MKLCIIGVIFCFLWVCICAQEASRNKFHPRAPKTHFESRNSFKSPQKLVKNVVEGTPKAPNSFRPFQEKNEEELKKFASHFKTRKAAGFRHDDPVVSKTFALILWTYLHLSFFILIYSSLFWTLFIIHACTDHPLVYVIDIIDRCVLSNFTIVIINCRDPVVVDGSGEEQVRGL